MEQQEKHLDILNFSGVLLCSIIIREHPIETGENNVNGHLPEKSNGKNNSHGSEEKMTDPQRKYLFRIFAEQGITGDIAHDKIKKLFDVKDLQDVSKAEASSKIDYLLKEAKGGSNGSSFK